jgi:hypothetical protein
MSPTPDECPASGTSTAQTRSLITGSAAATTSPRRGCGMPGGQIPDLLRADDLDALPELVSMAAYGHVTTVLVRDGRRLARIVPEEDAWIYSPTWQDKLRQAEADLAAGHTRSFADDEEFLRHR